MRLASESAEEVETRLSRRRGRDRARRAAQSSQATKNCRGSETASENVETENQRAYRFQKVRRIWRHDYPARRLESDLAYTNSV